MYLSSQYSLRLGDFSSIQPSQLWQRSHHKLSVALVVCAGVASQVAGRYKGELFISLHVSMTTTCSVSGCHDNTFFFNMKMLILTYSSLRWQLCFRLSTLRRSPTKLTVKSNFSRNSHAKNKQTNKQTNKNILMVGL